LTNLFRVIAAAKEMFEKFANGDKNAIHPNIRGSVYAICLKEGGKKEVFFRKLGAVSPVC